MKDQLSKALLQLDLRQIGHSRRRFEKSSMEVLSPQGFALIEDTEFGEETGGLVSVFA